MNRRLRVGMNLLWLRPGIVGGTESAATATLEALVDHAGDDLSLFAYAQPSFVAAHPQVAGSVHTRTVAVPGGAPGPRVAAESTWLPYVLRRDRIDVVHCYGGVVPPGVRRPSVLTVHDVQPLEAGSAFSPIKKRWLGTMLPRSVAAASVITVPSGFVRDRIMALLGVDPERIVVVPHALEQERAGMNGTDPDMVRERFGLGVPYVLYPAITYPHKNHRMLVEAFARVGPDAILVLAGGTAAAEPELAVTIERCGLGGRVRRTGRVSPDELAGLMAGASALAFPSRYEGFGLPVLEALGADTPVVAARAGSLPEIVGEAGVLVDPDDRDGWAHALRAALAGDFATPTWSERRRARVRRFDWKHTIPPLVQAYRRAAAEREKTG